MPFVLEKRPQVGTAARRKCYGLFFKRSFFSSQTHNVRILGAAPLARTAERLTLDLSEHHNSSAVQTRLGVGYGMDGEFVCNFGTDDTDKTEYIFLLTVDIHHIARLVS